MTHRSDAGLDTAREPASSGTGVPQAGNQEARRADLRRWKAIALSLLLLAAVIFLGCSWWQASESGAPVWVGYVRAAAEAGMVGGLADWFAVTALFRRPMGLPIPHTALIPNNKDRVGDALKDFVEENFLTADALSAKVRDAELPLWLARQGAEPGKAEEVSEWIGQRAASVVEDLDPAEAEQFIRTQVMDRLAEPEWGPPLGRLLEGYIADGKARPLEDDLIDWAHKKILGMESTVVTAIDERMPGWAPRFAREMVGDKVYSELVNFAEEVRRDGNHEARLAIRRNLSKLAADLQWDADMRERIENIKQEMLASDQVQQAPAAMWRTISTTLIDQFNDPESFLRQKMTAKVKELAHRLLEDSEFLAQTNDLVDKAARYAVEKFAPEIIAIIPETIKRWDAQEASQNIELMVGKDLQFIRLNGTIVGSLAGLAIYAVNHLIFGA
ncbi:MULTISPECIES: DUF445 domain-containing protein [unclassified Corynebacterium]|uniref:DUF445 domain-containing protein n=1 Tax=Corynebacterium TaxID=1716 RepID=UPI0025518295|nr:MULTISPECIES: DUF445 domain-containing protein [unclassified Corynebacterium]MDK8476880.1 DUF445 domain-containing protein [Corynebacterium sp. MSK310]MDK8673363.1 DUF445 domain-containing protein [Corynebacterium sp. MSK189]MDK8736620.1 DUF445 domain-containing protein [Corynebacterium sp. MSK306]